ncbi:MAG: hypothetical protein ACK4MT_09680, partial [Thermaurantiacus tibetensis]
MRRVRLAHPADLEGFRHALRALVAEGTPPAEVLWETGPQEALPLAEAPGLADAPPLAAREPRPARVDGEALAAGGQERPEPGGRSGGPHLGRAGIRAGGR